MLDNLTVEDFQSLEGREVQLRFGDHAEAARVLSTRQGKSVPEGHRLPFSLILRAGTGERYWPQGTYVFVHPRHGELELFMVPIGPDEQGMRYEISFS